MILGDLTGIGDQAAAIVIGALVLAALGALGRLIWKIWLGVSRMSDHVLPHFLPPSAEEIRAGTPDNTIPTQLRELKEEQASVARDLRTHVAEETEDRKNRQTVVDEQFERGDKRMEAIEDKLDETLIELKAGNPEVRS